MIPWRLGLLFFYWPPPSHDSGNYFLRTVLRNQSPFLPKESHPRWDQKLYGFNGKNNWPFMKQFIGNFVEYKLPLLDLRISNARNWLPLATSLTEEFVCQWQKLFLVCLRNWDKWQWLQHKHTYAMRWVVIPWHAPTGGLDCGSLSVVEKTFATNYTNYFDLQWPPFFVNFSPNFWSL